MRTITASEITATGTLMANEGRGTQKWRRSVDLAAEIANDPEYQGAMIKAFELAEVSPSNPVAVSDAIGVSDELAIRKYGKQVSGFFGILQTANRAVTAELKKTRTP